MGMRISIKLITISLVSLLILTASIYYPSLFGGFYHDDRPNLVFNKDVQIDILSIESIQKAATSSSAGTLLRPISMASFALNYYFFGDDPFSFKLTNVFLHFITAIFVFLVTHKINNTVSNSRNNNSSFALAAVVATIWLIHPLHVSTVAYAIQRMAILSTLFSLIAIFFYMVGRDKILTDIRSGSFLLFMCIISILLGIYSKENAALTPFFIALLEVIIFYPQTKSEKYKQYLKYFTLFVLIIMITLFIIFHNNINNFISNWYHETREFTASERLYTQSRIIIYYIKWLMLPNIQELGLFHDDIPLSNSITSPITTLLSIIAIITLIAIAFIVRKKHPIIALGIGWFFIGHILESTIIPLEMIYEHRNYLPSVGLILIVSHISSHAILRFKKLNLYKHYIFFITVAIFSTITYVRASQWSDPINFAYFEALHHPNSLRASHILGLEYKGMVEQGYGEYRDDAYKYLDKASQLGERRLFSEFSLIQLAHSLNEPANPIWIDRMTKKLSVPVLRIEDILIIKELTLCKNSTCLLPRDASEVLFDAIKSNPRLNLDSRIEASYYSARANFILERGGDPNEAEGYLKKAIPLTPNKIQNYVDYINFLILMGRPTEAIHYLESAKEKNRRYENMLLLDELSDTINKTIFQLSRNKSSNEKPFN